MLSTTIFCDRCGDCITENRSHFIAQCGPAMNNSPSIDLCSDCEAGLRSWLEERTARDAIREPVALEKAAR